VYLDCTNAGQRSEGAIRAVARVQNTLKRTMVRRVADDPLGAVAKNYAVDPEVIGGGCRASISEALFIRAKLQIVSIRRILQPLVIVLRAMPQLTPLRSIVREDDRTHPFRTTP